MEIGEWIGAELSALRKFKQAVDKAKRVGGRDEDGWCACHKPGHEADAFGRGRSGVRESPGEFRLRAGDEDRKRSSPGLFLRTYDFATNAFGRQCLFELACGVLHRCAGSDGVSGIDNDGNATAGRSEGCASDARDGGGSCQFEKVSPLKRRKQIVLHRIQCSCEKARVREESMRQVFACPCEE